MARRQGRIFLRWRIARLILGKRLRRRLDWAGEIPARDTAYAPISGPVLAELRSGIYFSGWIKAEPLHNGLVDLVLKEDTDRGTAESENG